MNTFIVFAFMHDGRCLTFRARTSTEWEAIDEVETEVGLVKTIFARRQA